MFTYEPSWSDAAVRRFIARIGTARVEELLALREADNVGSGLAPSDGPRRAAPAGRRAAGDAGRPDRCGLAVDGGDLIAELGLRRGPGSGGSSRRCWTA